METATTSNHQNLWITLLRPHQWLKNLLVFAAILFSKHYSIWSDWLATILVFVAFCFASSGIYLVNDWIDRQSDQKHPTKRFRPLASGKISVKKALIVAILLLSASIFLVSLVNLQSLWILSGYILLMILYSLVLKKVLLLDMIILAFGILMRAMIGAVAISVTISHWLIICLFFLAMMLASAKRRSEIKLLQSEVFEPRTSLLSSPPIAIWDIWCIGFGLVTMMAYALYTVDSQTVEKIGSTAMIATIPIVVLGILRFQYLVFVQNAGDDTAKTILKDPLLLVTIMVWLAVSYAVISR